MGRGLGNVNILSKIQRVFSTVHGPGPDGLVLVQATPRAEVDVIGVQRCEIARAAIF